MRTVRQTTMVGLLVGSLILASGAGAFDAQSKDYTADGSPLLVCGSGSDEPSSRGACFDVIDAVGSKLGIQIFDELDSPDERAAGNYRFLDGQDLPLEPNPLADDFLFYPRLRGDFCGGTGATVPTGAAWLEVTLRQPGPLDYYCFRGTSGTISVSVADSSSSLY